MEYAYMEKSVFFDNLRKLETDCPEIRKISARQFIRDHYDMISEAKEQGYSLAAIYHALGLKATFSTFTNALFSVRKDREKTTE